MLRSLSVMFGWLLFVVTFLWMVATQRGEFVNSSSPTIQSTTKKHNEPFYTKRIAKQRGWRSEVTTPIGTRCDLVTSSQAIEVEWPNKCYEALGQSLHYASELELKPVMLFLISEESEREYVLSRVGKPAKEIGVQIIWYNIND